MEDNYVPESDELPLPRLHIDEELDDDDEEPLDARVQVELETLNAAAESINKLENELQKARAKFRLLKAESSQRLGSLYKKIGRKWVVKARPYYDLLKQSHKAQVEAQKAAIRYQRANSIYRAAKETVTLAEQQLLTEGGEKLSFDSAWQEMLNHATMRFMEAEKEKRVSEQEHQTRAAEYNAIQLRLGLILKDMSRTVSKAKPFYELKDKLESRLQAERQNAEDLHLALICSKQKYKLALSSLECISEDVHNSRERRRRLDLPQRTPGVGAESDAWSEVSELPSVALDFMSEAGSQASFEDFSDIDLDIGDWDDQPTSPSPYSEYSLQDKGQTPSLESAESGISIGSGAQLPFWSRFGNNLSRVAQDLSSGNKKSPYLDLPQQQHHHHHEFPLSGEMVHSDQQGHMSTVKIEKSVGHDHIRSWENVNQPMKSKGSVQSMSKGIGPSPLSVRDDLVDGAEEVQVTEHQQDVTKMTRSVQSPVKSVPSFQSSRVDGDDDILISKFSKTSLARPYSAAITSSRQYSEMSTSVPTGKPPLPIHRTSSGKSSRQDSGSSSSLPSVRSSPNLAVHSETDVGGISPCASHAANDVNHKSSNNDLLPAIHSNEASNQTEALAEARSAAAVTIDRSVPLNDEIFV